MNAMLGLLIPALLGVDYGWERKTDGTIAYVVQVDPETFAEMQRTGQAIGSSLPANVRSRVSDFSFRVGREPLPNQNTLPPAETTATNGTGGGTPTYVKADYPPATYPPALSNVTMPSTTTANWPVTPGTVPSVTLPPGVQPSNTTSWAQNTVPTSASANPPLSTSGFPMNPNAPPPAAYPNQTPTTNSNAWGNTTAPPSLSPPSLNNGPRITQPQPWSTPPREVTISARMPQEPSTPLSSTPTGSNMAGPTLPAGALPPTNNYPTNNQPGYNNNGAYPTNGNYPPPNGAPTNPQYASNNYPPAGTAPPPQNYNQQNPNQGNQSAPPPANWQQEPRSASATHPVTQATTNTPAAPAEQQWVPLTLVLIGFLTSLAANFYFGWSKYQVSERLRMLLADRGTF